MPKGVAKGLSGVIMDTAKQAAKEPTNVVRQAAGQLGVGPVPGAEKKTAKSPPLPSAPDEADRREIGQITGQLSQMGRADDRPVQPQAPQEADSSGGKAGPQLEPGRVEKLDREVAQAREKKEKKYKEIEEDFLRRLEEDRKREEKAMEADAAEIIPQGRQKKGLPLGVKGKQGTKETKFKQGK